MAYILDKLLDLSGLVPFTGAYIQAFLAADQSPPLTNVNGTPKLPTGTAVASYYTDSVGNYLLDGLTEGVVYDLFVTPVSGFSFWIAGRVPDAVVTAEPCVLYGTVDPSTDMVWAFLETPCIVTGGVHIVNGTVYSPVSSTGSFSLSLYPTSALTPPSLYRVTVGASIYRGTVPGQSSIQLDDWIALDTTQQIS